MDNNILIYISFIEECRKKDLPDYTEKHHIIPKCMGGSNSSKNLIRLSYPDHCYAHILLARAYDDPKLWRAACFMNPCDTEARINHSEYMKVNNPSHRKDVKEKISKKAKERYEKYGSPCLGRVYRPETIKRMSESSTGIFHSEETKKKIKKSTLGLKKSDEMKKKLSKNNKNRVTVVHKDDINGKGTVIYKDDPLYLDGTYIPYKSTPHGRIQCATNTGKVLIKNENGDKSYSFPDNIPEGWEKCVKPKIYVGTGGKNNGRAQKINIYDINDNLIQCCHGNIFHYIKDNKLPPQLVNSYKNGGEPIFKSNRSKASARTRGMGDYIGWYAVKVDD